jgi:hypothetical protein
MRGLRNDIVDGIGYIIHVQQGAILICHCPHDVIAVPGARLKPGQAGARLYLLIGMFQTIYPHSMPFLFSRDRAAF